MFLPSRSGVTGARGQYIGFFWLAEQKMAFKQNDFELNNTIHIKSTILQKNQIRMRK